MGSWKVRRRALARWQGFSTGWKISGGAHSAGIWPCWCQSPYLDRLRIGDALECICSKPEMHGKGTFFDPRLDDSEQFPVAARNGSGNVRNKPDLITPKLSALHFYQLTIPAPSPPEGSFSRIGA